MRVCVYTSRFFFCWGNRRHPHIETCIGCQNMCKYVECLNERVYFLFFSCGNIRNARIERCVGCQNMCDYTGCDIIDRIRTECTRPLYTNYISESRTMYIGCQNMCKYTGCDNIHSELSILEIHLCSGLCTPTSFQSHELCIWVTNYVYSNS